MNRNLHLHSSSKLTEFARNFETQPETLLNKVVNRITNVYNSSSNAGNISSPPATANVENIDVQIPRRDETRDYQNVQEKDNSTLTRYRDSELQQFWMPDSKSRECFECTQKFSTFRRKHHCRLCGQIFCSKCCSQIISGKSIGCSGDLKVCTYCSKRHLVMNDNFDDKIGSLTSTSDTLVPHRKLHDHQGEEFLSIPFCAGTENINIVNDASFSAELTDQGFRESRSFKPIEKRSTSADYGNERLRIGSSVDGHTDNFPSASAINEVYSHTAQPEGATNGLSDELNTAYKHREKLLLGKFLKNENLDQSWATTLLPICTYITTLLKPEKWRTEIWDIRNYVNFKKIPGGSRSDSHIIPGVAFSKNVIHKDMMDPIENPRILLLNCPIVYQREGKYINLETLKLQEEEYLRNVVGRIQSLRPNIVIVQKTVSGMAQDMLRSQGITFILDVKPSVICRISKCLQCDIVSSVDSSIGRPILGMCSQFEIKKFTNLKQTAKHIVILNRSESSPRNCCVVLRGGTEDELIKVKRIAKQILFNRYNWRFEVSLLTNEFAFYQSNEILQQNMRSDLSGINSSKNEIDVESGQLNENCPEEHNLTHEKSDNCEISNISEVIKADQIPYFLRIPLSFGPETRGFQTLLSQFRACNGILKKKPKLKFLDKTKQKSSSTGSGSIDTKEYQISMLFCCSYCNPHTALIFCTQPYLLTMQFYGQHDFRLGDFLEKYCFRNTYMCESCTFPMLNHVRRYVHETGYVQVELSICDPSEESNGNILIQSKCIKCAILSPKVKLSTDTWYLSFGKYLESRFYNRFYKLHPKTTTQICAHSLHQDHIEMFFYNGIIASFSYCDIKIWELNFPSMIVPLASNKRMSKSIADDIKMFIPRGYDVYVKIYEKLTQLPVESECSIISSFAQTLKDDQSAYGAQEEILNALLLDEQEDCFIIADALFELKKILADSIDSWAQRFNEYLSQRRSICNTKQEQSESSQSETKMNHQTEDTSATNDKKKILTIIKDIFPSDKSIQYILQSPIPPNEHYCLPVGELPIIVCDEDLSSIISYTLVSDDYKQFIAAVGEESQSRKMCDSQSESEDKDSEKDRKKQHHNFVDIMFRDTNFGTGTTQFTCRIYFPREFEDMRTSFLQRVGNTKQENEEDPKSCHLRCQFARSLSKSVRWDARGGKSGSKFSKTTDDRFILKEMSKQELTIFENFAPQYFQYINSCWRSNHRTLLAKIFGVYRISVKKENIQEKYLLVMENLFYNCEISKKFDLKGSNRNRLVDPNTQNGERVLQDENLIQMSWSDPLYITMKSKSILVAAIRRDATFLQTNDVMDYSMLVGQCNESRTLFLGIIDYIRTYTLDKKIESMVKQSVLLGGQGKLPTIISPKQYKERFSTAMERYFLAVPDRQHASMQDIENIEEII